jgi:UDP-glucose 4-epimerase
MQSDIKEVLVTGGAGFIGSHMVELLLRKKFKVYVIDNFSTGRKENLKKFLKDNNLCIIKSNILDKKKITKIFKNLSYIFHFAGKGDIVPSIDNPDVYFQTNVLGTMNILQCARISKKLKKFVYAASSSCYGIAKTPTTEAHKISTEHPYALSKYQGEQIAFHWNKIYKIPVASIRIFNAYGPKVRTSGVYGAVFGVFFKQLLQNKPLTIVGDGNQSRDFLYVTDVCSAFYKIALSSKSNGEFFNLGSGSPVTINYLAKILGGKKIKIPNRPGEPKSTWANINKITNTINWRPIVNFEKGVNNMLENITYWNNAPLWTPKKIENATKNWFKYLKN